jgi:hypothetical protein
MRDWTVTLCVCISLFGARFAPAADEDGARLHLGRIAFRVVKTQSGTMIEMKTKHAVVLVPRLRVTAGKWFGEGEMRPNDEALEWTGVNGTKLTATNFLVNPVGPPSSATAISLRSVATSTGPMVEIKTRGLVALVPYLTFVDRRKEVEIHPIGDQLGSSDGESTATFTSMSLDP